MQLYSIIEVKLVDDITPRSVRHCGFVTSHNSFSLPGPDMGVEIYLSAFEVLTEAFENQISVLNSLENVSLV